MRISDWSSDVCSSDLTATVTADGVAHIDLLLGNAADTILIVGQRANLASAISRQRAAGTVETVLTRDAIGQFPDQNVAEAVRRAPGVNVLNDQGEGRFVSVRGLDPNLRSEEHTSELQSLMRN